MRHRILLIPALLFLLASASLAGDKNDKTGQDGTLVDQGAFAVFQSGRQVATENFTIRQFPAYSITSSEVHLDSGQTSGVLQQSSQLTLLPNGNLSRYEFKQESPTRRSLTVDPSDQFLTMHSVADGKTTSQTFFLTPAAFVLDDYFFITREVLLWRYLASSCKPATSGDGCDLIRARFPILIPRRNTSDEVYVEFKGYDDTPWNGRPQHLRRFLMQIDGEDWSLWLDSNQKLIRISIPQANTEVLRQQK